MKKKVLLCSLVILCVCFGFSQEKGKVGFLFKAGSTNSVGLSLNLSDRVTLRPSLGFYSGEAEVEISVINNIDSQKVNAYNASLGLFYHFLKKDNLSAYTGLEFGYLYQKVESNSCTSLFCGTLFEKNHGILGDLVLGLQYNLNKHLAVFGEIGLGFEHQKSDRDVQDIQGYTQTVKTTIWSLNRSGFGIILYL